MAYEVESIIHFMLCTSQIPSNVEENIQEFVQSCNLRCKKIIQLKWSGKKSKLIFTLPCCFAQVQKSDSTSATLTFCSLSIFEF